MIKNQLLTSPFFFSFLKQFKNDVSKRGFKSKARGQIILLCFVLKNNICYLASMYSCPDMTLCCCWDIKPKNSFLMLCKVVMLKLFSNCLNPPPPAPPPPPTHTHRQLDHKLCEVLWCQKKRVLKSQPVLSH